MSAALAGDAAAYRALLAGLGRHLRAYYAKRLGGTGDVEDLVQETLIAMHTRRATYDPTQPLTPWVYAIARYKLIDHLRQKGRRQTVPIENASDVFDETAREDAVTAPRDVERLLEALPERSRQLVRDIKVRGLSVEETATRTGLSESAVKVAVHRAMRTLSAMLNGGGRP